jgi:uncharacterized membrane protein YccF (DUF307 family)
VEAMAICLLHVLETPKGLFTSVQIPLAIQRLKVAFVMAREFGFLGRTY